MNLSTFLTFIGIIATAMNEDSSLPQVLALLCNSVGPGYHRAVRLLGFWSFYFCLARIQVAQTSLGLAIAMCLGLGLGIFRRFRNVDGSISIHIVTASMAPISCLISYLLLQFCSHANAADEGQDLEDCLTDNVEGLVCRAHFLGATGSFYSDADLFWLVVGILILFTFGFAVCRIAAPITTANLQQACTIVTIAAESCWSCMKACKQALDRACTLLKEVGEPVVKLVKLVSCSAWGYIRSLFEKPLVQPHRRPYVPLKRGSPCPTSTSSTCDTTPSLSQRSIPGAILHAKPVACVPVARSLPLAIRVPPRYGFYVKLQGGQLPRPRPAPVPVSERRPLSDPIVPIQVQPPLPAKQTSTVDVAEPLAKRQRQEALAPPMEPIRREQAMLDMQAVGQKEQEVAQEAVPAEDPMVIEQAIAADHAPQHGVESIAEDMDYEYTVPVPAPVTAPVAAPVAAPIQTPVQTPVPAPVQAPIQPDMEGFTMAMSSLSIYTEPTFTTELIARTAPEVQMEETSQASTDAMPVLALASIAAPTISEVQMGGMEPAETMATPPPANEVQMGGMDQVPTTETAIPAPAPRQVGVARPSTAAAPSSFAMVPGPIPGPAATLATLATPATQQPTGPIPAPPAAALSWAKPSGKVGLQRPSTAFLASAMTGEPSPAPAAAQVPQRNTVVRPSTAFLASGMNSQPSPAPEAAPEAAQAPRRVGVARPSTASAPTPVNLIFRP